MARKFGTQGTAPLFPPESNWKPPSLSDLPSWTNAKRVGFDTEFRDDTLIELGCGARRGAKMAGYSFMLDGHKPFYVPIRHPEGNVDCEQGLAYLRDNLNSYHGELIGANLTGDLDIAYYENIRPDYSQVIVRDVLIAGPLIWELHFTYNLQDECERYHIPGKDKTLLKDAAINYGWDVKKQGWEACIPRIPSKYVGPYAEQDVAVLFPLLDAQLLVIEKQGLQEVWDLESSLVPLLLKMRQRGVRIDQDQLGVVERWALEEESRTNDEIKHLTGWEIGVGNCMTARMVAPALQAIGVEVGKDKRGQYSVTKELLASIDHPVARKIRYLREMNKLRSTFAASIRSHMTNGRIHPTFRQIVGNNDSNEKTGAAYGRLSSCSPNIQQQPSRGKYASMWRKIYLPEEGMTLASIDASAQEPRWTVHFADLLGLKGAKTLADEYRRNPRIDPHSAMAKLIYGDEFTKEERTMAKTIFLAVSYSQGGKKLCNDQLKLPTRWLLRTEEGEKRYFETRGEAMKFRHSFEGKCHIHEVAGIEGQAILDKFHSGAPFVRELSQKVMEKIEACGFIKVLGGRILHFPLDDNGEYMWSYKGLNRLIQASSGYHFKMAMLEIDRNCKDFFGQIQVHDEIVGSVSDIKVCKQVADIICGVVKARIPFEAECEIGPNWGSSRPLCHFGHCTNFLVDGDKWACHEHTHLHR